MYKSQLRAEDFKICLREKQAVKIVTPDNSFALPIQPDAYTYTSRSAQLRKLENIYRLKQAYVQTVSHRLYNTIYNFKKTHV